MPNCLKNCPDRRQEANGQEYRNDGSDRDDRQTDFIRRFQRGLIGRFAHLMWRTIFSI
jgi:hypothetical protein